MGHGEKIGVGIIGANGDNSWAAQAHVPALRALSDRFDLVALSTTRQDTADAAARRFGVAHAFDNHADLVTHPEVDLVVVAVKVPAHLELVVSALRAGKAVYCEWPLGNGLAEAERMTALAKEQGVVAAIGLQGRAAPVVRRVRDLIGEGYVGAVRSTTLVASGGNWGATVAGKAAYIADRRNGATMLEINLAHTVDALCWCLGEFRELSSYLLTLDPTIRIAETGETIEKTAADQIVVSGVLDGGAVANIHYRGGISRGTNFLWEINGTEGDLVVTLDDPIGSLDELKLLGSVGSIQLGALRLHGARAAGRLAELEIPPRYTPAANAPTGLPFNLTQAYAMFAEEMRAGGTPAITPTFDDAVVRHRMMAAVETAAATGTRTSYR